MAELGLWRLLPVLVAIAAICGMAMVVTGQDNECSAAGGRLEWSLSSRTLAVCVRDGVVIHP